MKKNLHSILCPKTVAVIGASKKEGSVGNEVLKNLVNNKFNGAIYPVNLNETEILGLPCTKSVKEIKGSVDLAVIIVPAKFVVDTLKECGAKGIKAAIIISAGFKEVGAEGKQLEDLVLATAQTHGITILGPNCLGALNTNPKVSFNATFAPLKPVQGSIGFASQSGALCSGIINLLPTLNVGVSHLVSLGNQADIVGSDIMNYWQDASDVGQAMFYLEGIDNPSAFQEEATRLTAKKPVIVIKSGRSSEGAKAAASHTGSLAGVDVSHQALMDSCGVIREDNLRDAFNTAMVFNKCPLPKGKRVAIITNSGGPGILTTDKVIEHGLAIAGLSEKTKNYLRSKLDPKAAVGNPVDTIASASVEQYAEAIGAVLADDNVDMLVVIYLYITGQNDIAILTHLNNFKKKYPHKPILGVFMTEETFKDRIAAQLPGNDIAYFNFVEEAALGLKRLYERSVYLNSCKAKPPVVSVNKSAADKIIKSAAERFKKQPECNNTLTTFESLEIFSSYGLPLPKYALVKSEADLKANASRIGYPAVLKISSYSESHKSDIGGVVLNIQNFEQLGAEYKRLAELKGLEGVVLMQQVKGAREFVAGVSSYEDLHMLMFGLGGIFIEALNEVKFIMLPLNAHGCNKLLSSGKIEKLLGEVRGQAAIDKTKLEQLFYKIDRLITDFGNIAELDMNPIMADKAGNLWVVDARIALNPLCHK